MAEFLDVGWTLLNALAIIVTLGWITRYFLKKR